MRKLLIGSLFMFFLGFVLSQCKTQSKSTEVREELSGEELSKLYCVACHKYPEPALLNKATWNDYVLVRMAAYLGIYTDNNSYFGKMPDRWVEPGLGGERVRNAKVYPEKPLLAVKEWESIRDYYLDSAPEKLAKNPDKLDIKIGLPFFEESKFNQLNLLSPHVQSIAFDTVNQRIYAGGLGENIYEFDSKGRQRSIAKSESYVVDIKRVRDQIYVLDMGTRIASDNPAGSLTKMQTIKDFGTPEAELVLSQLMRPVHFEITDFNLDGKDDFVVSEYGNLLGALNVYMSSSRGYDRVTLLEEDGAIRTELRDINNDGQLDILALMGNANEGVDQYINNGNGGFVKERLVEFDASFGSTHFTAVDWNHDGKQELLYSNGDNGDYLPLMKPYHGIRLYIDNGGGFEEKFFIPMNGVYQAEAADLDLDGDMDIVAVSFHPDHQNDMKESFQVFMNDGDDTFSAFTISEYDQSRWMRFLLEDIDRDGDLDIILTAMNIKTPEISNEISNKWEESEKAMLLIRNMNQR
ncbi:VCBS repeat-containing protein [Saprospiraceae bacterium]|nr:VCBS repeat-containing protein [Saprospiraceae bacterium]